MRIEILAAYRRSGMKSGVLRTSASSLLKRPYNKSKRLIAITWEPVTGFELKVLEGGIPFSDRVDIFQRELASIHSSNQPNPSVLNGTLSLLWTSIEFGASEAIRLAATIDTNLSDFSRLPLIDLGDGETAVNVTLKVDCYHQGMQDIVDSHDIIVDIRPAKQLERFRGYMALDFGNTSSSVVRLRPGVDDISDLQVIHLDPDLEQRNLPSAVRINALEVDKTKPLQMAEAKCYFGNKANWSEGGVLFLGAKRVLADSDPRPMSLNLNGSIFSVSKRFPAELLLGAMLQKLGEQPDKPPYCAGAFALTYPTTFSVWEAEQLRKAAYYGLRRAVGKMEYFPQDVGMVHPNKAEMRRVEEDYEKKAKENIPLMIDEASAASIFHVYKDFVKRAGSIRALRYLYPHGLRVLLYDCGGGTTDIALVKATGIIVPDEESEKDRYRLKIDVLGRTGHRTFGGDNMTISVLRLLKARIAERLKSDVNTSDSLDGLVLPNDPAELPAALDRLAHLIEKVVPTKDKDPGDYDEFLDLRRSAVQELWDWAERIKRHLSTDTEVNDGLTVLPEKSQLIKLLNSEHGENDWAELIEGIIFKQSEVDALLIDRVDESIDKMNKMILKKLIDETGRHEEVDLVYVVGNASRYPLISRRIKERLQVRFIEDRLRFDGDINRTEPNNPNGQLADVSLDRIADLKNAVAKGACIALMIIQEHRNLDLEFDRDIVYRLPYDLMIPKLGEGVLSPAIFEEGQHCLHLQPHTEPPPAAVEGRPRPTRMQLHRLWPGETRSEPYLEFDFGHEIQGPVLVQFDKKSRRFMMQDANDARPTFGRQVAVADYVSPVQSGTL